MDLHFSDVPELVRKVAPTDQPREDPTDEAGRALIAMLQQAAGLSSENCERATLLSTRLARELLAAEGRIKEPRSRHFPLP
jgi:hypothetical protein